MASRSTWNSRSSKTNDVRRTLFRSLSRSTVPAGSGLDDVSSSSQSSGGLGGGEDDSGSEGSIVVRKPDGTFDIEAPLAIHEHLRMQDMERELAEQRALKRHRVDVTRGLPELLRMKVLSLQQDNWMYDAEDDG